MTTATMEREDIYRAVRELPDEKLSAVLSFIRELRENGDDMAKARRNAEYLTMIDTSIKELEEGKIVIKSMEELESMEE
jgi:hypothetical protein